MNYYSLNKYLKNTFGEKVYKISLNGNMTCPNRDGTLGTRGCIFEKFIKGVVIHNKTPDKLKRSAEKPTFVSFDILERKSMKSSCKHYPSEVKVFFVYL